MLIDTHTHIRIKKIDWLERITKIIVSIKKHKIDGMVVLDHDYYPQADVFDAINSIAIKNCVKLFRGIEMTLKINGGVEHLVVISKTQTPFELGQNITQEHLKDLDMWRKESLATVILAHPFRKGAVLLDFNNFKPDALEFSRNTPHDERRFKIYELSKMWNIPIVSSSDAHHHRHVGNFVTDFFNFKNNFNDITEDNIVNEILSNSIYGMEKRFVNVEDFMEK